MRASAEGSSKLSTPGKLSVRKFLIFFLLFNKKALERALFCV